MKKTVIISLISVTLFAFTTVTNKQNLIKDSCANTFDNEKIWNGNLSEDKLDEFLKGSYTVVKGDISIENTKLTDLKSLANLKRCEGTFYILNNDKLHRLRGLQNLDFIKGKLSIINNKDLSHYCSLNKTLINQGIVGIEIRKGIYEKVETEGNYYNPSIMDLQNGGDCERPTIGDVTLMF